MVFVEICFTKFMRYKINIAIAIERTSFFFIFSLSKTDETMNTIWIIFLRSSEIKHSIDNMCMIALTFFFLCHFLKNNFNFKKYILMCWTQIILNNPMDMIIDKKVSFFYNKILKKEIIMNYTVGDYQRIFGWASTQKYFHKIHLKKTSLKMFIRVLS